MNKTARFLLFIKLFLLNIFCLGVGYFCTAHIKRFFLTVFFFLVIFCFYVFGFPIEAYTHLPYYLLPAYCIALFLDAVFLSIRAKLDFFKEHSKHRIVLATLICFVFQWVFLCLYQILFTHNLTTTHTLYVSSPNMLPQFTPDNLVITRAWAWRPRIIGEKGLQRGDIVIHMTGNSVLGMRRIIALPGETMTLQGGIARINGKTYEYTVPTDSKTFDFPTPTGMKTGMLIDEKNPNGRSYAIITKEHLKEVNEPEDAVFTIPEGFVGVMSDNRPITLKEDMRSDLVIPLDAILSRPLYIIDANDKTRIGQSIY